MRIVLIAIACLFIAVYAHGQVNNVYTTAGIPQTIGAPTFVPGARGSIIAIDTVTGLWWVNPNRLSGTTWIKMGHAMREISGCSTPVSAPTKFQSWLVVNACTEPEVYLWNGSAWKELNAGGGGAGTVTTNATLTGDGSIGTPLGIAQQSAVSSEVLTWTGAAWEPTYGNPYTFVTTGATITTAVNEILIGTVAGDVTMGLPVCDATTDSKRFKFVRNGSDAFSVTIDPNGSQAFYDGDAKKTQYGKIAIDCTCRFSGTGVWFFDNQ